MIRASTVDFAFRNREKLHSLAVVSQRCVFSKTVDSQPFEPSLASDEKISYGKLSQLQKLILVALSEPRYAVMKRREFNRTIKWLYYGKDSRVATASLSRAYQRLEDRQYISRSGGRWSLTDSNPLDNGVMLVILPRFEETLGGHSEPIDPGPKAVSIGGYSHRRPPFCSTSFF